MVIMQIILCAWTWCMDPLSPYSSDPSLTPENVTMVMETVDDFDIYFILKMDVVSLQQFRGGKSMAIDYFIKYSPYASWGYLAGRLYWKEEDAALSAARKFIKRKTGMCVFVHSVMQSPNSSCSN